MQRHPQLIEKNEDSGMFWNAVKSYITPYIKNKSDVEYISSQIKEGKISEISLSELRFFRNKLACVYGNNKIDELLYDYNIFLGRDHYYKLLEKKTGFKNIT